MTPYHGLDRAAAAEPSPASASRPASPGVSGSSPDAGRRRHDFLPLPRFDAELAFDRMDHGERLAIGAWAVGLIASLTASAVLGAGSPLGTPPAVVHLLLRAHTAAVAHLTSPVGLDELADLVLDRMDDPSAVTRAVGPICRGCGCSSLDACTPQCWWVEADGLDGLCSTCAAGAVAAGLDVDAVLPCEVRLPSADGSVLTLRAGARLGTLVEALRAREAVAQDGPLLFATGATP